MFDKMDAAESLVPPNHPPVVSWRQSIRQTIASLLVCLPVLNAGANMAYSALLLPQLRAEGSDIKIDVNEATWIASLVTISLPIGSLAVGPAVDRLGRKYTSIYICVPLGVAWLVIAFASSIWQLYLARILLGCMSGLTMASIVYISEVTTPKMRSMLLSLNSVYVSLGILITCMFGLWLNWRLLAGLYCFLTLGSMAVQFFAPETPHWYLQFGKDREKMAKSLHWLYTKQEVYEYEYNELVKSEDSKIIKEDLKLRAYLKKPSVYKPTVILMFLFFFQQLSGGYVIIFYAIDVFEMLGVHFKEGFNEYSCLAILGLIRFVMSLVTVVVSKRYGRRPILMASSLGMSASCFAAAVHLCLNPVTSADSNRYILPLVCILLFVLFSAFGVLVIPWTMIGELLPVRVRGLIGGFMISLAYIFMFGMVKSFPYLVQWLNIHIVLFVFTVTNLVLSVFVFAFLPETFNKTFTDIENYFEKSSD